MFVDSGLREAAAVPGRRERSLSICFVAPHAWSAVSGDPRRREIGGAEVQQSILARLFAASGYRVSMICLDHGQPDPIVVDGVTVHRAFHPDAGLPVVRFAHPRLTSMWRALRVADADIYYYRSTSMWIGVIAEFCARHGRHAVYAGASDRDFVPGHGGQIRYARDRWLFRRGIERADAIVAQNEVQRAQVREHFGREALVIPSCYVLPEDAFPGRGDEVLWVGTMHDNKRPQMLLDLAARLPHRRFVMIGGPSANGRTSYEAAKARAAGLANVEFTGFLPLAEVERRFDRARVLVSTSVYEGMPNVFLQAWARGVPTVATVDVGPNRHVQDLEEMEAGVERLFDGCAWRAASRTVRDYFAKNHSPAQALERYGRLFREITA
jgi:glycosyltransferase involved in cell wall biosynthesis